MPGNQVIIDTVLRTYPEEFMEVDNPGFQESGSIKLRLTNKYRIRQTSMNRDTMIVQDINTTRTLVTISKELKRLCHEEFTEYWVNKMLLLLEVNPHVIDVWKTVIVLKAVNMALITKLRGLKQFGVVADIEVTTTKEVVLEREELVLIMMESREQDLRRVFLRSGMSCVICLDDFEIGSEVVFMPCSHMFHEGCLDCWLKESHSCPLCRLELTD